MPKTHGREINNNYLKSIMAKGIKSTMVNVISELS